MRHRAMENNAVSPWFEAALAKYGWVVVWAIFGFAAKYGLLIKKGKPVTARMVVADTLTLGVVVLIALNIIEKLGVRGEAGALVTALIAVGADRGIRMLADRFWRQVGATLTDPAQEGAEP